MPDVRINIKATNNVGPAAQGAVRDVERMRRPIQRVHSAMEGFGALMRGDIAGGVAQIGRGMIGSFGAAATKIGAITAAFGIG